MVEGGLSWAVDPDRKALNVEPCDNHHARPRGGTLEVRRRVVGGAGVVVGQGGRGVAVGRGGRTPPGRLLGARPFGTARYDIGEVIVLPGSNEDSASAGVQTLENTVERSGGFWMHLQCGLGAFWARDGADIGPVSSTFGSPLWTPE